MKIFFLVLIYFSFIVLGYAQDDEAEIQEIEKQRTERMKKMEAIEKIATPPAIPVDFSMKDLGSEKFQKMLEEQLKNNPLKSLDREALKNTIKELHKDKPLGKVFAVSPATLDIMVDFIRDDKALPSLLKLLQRKDDLQTYAIIWIVILVVFWWLKKKIVPQETPFLKRFLLRTCISLMGTAINLIFFYNMFENEIKPTWDIVKLHLF